MMMRQSLRNDLLQDLMGNPNDDCRKYHHSHPKRRSVVERIPSLMEDDDDDDDASSIRQDNSLAEKLPSYSDFCKKKEGSLRERRSLHRVFSAEQTLDNETSTQAHALRMTCRHHSKKNKQRIRPCRSPLRRTSVVRRHMSAPSTMAMNTNSIVAAPRRSSVATSTSVREWKATTNGDDQAPMVPVRWQDHQADHVAIVSQESCCLPTKRPSKPKLVLGSKRHRELVMESLASLSLGEQ